MVGPLSRGHKPGQPSSPCASCLTGVAVGAFDLGTCAIRARERSAGSALGWHLRLVLCGRAGTPVPLVANCGKYEVSRSGHCPRASPQLGRCPALAVRRIQRGPRTLPNVDCNWMHAAGTAMHFTGGIQRARHRQKEDNRALSDGARTSRRMRMNNFFSALQIYCGSLGCAICRLAAPYHTFVDGY